MKNITLQIIIATLLAPLSAEGLQLFGSKKSAEKDRGSASSSLSSEDESYEDFSSTEVATRKNIESVLLDHLIHGTYLFGNGLVLKKIYHLFIKILHHKD